MRRIVALFDTDLGAVADSLHNTYSQPGLVGSVGKVWARDGHGRGSGCDARRFTIEQSR